MVWKTALKPRWIAGLLFAMVLSGVFVLLSQWQFGRSTTPDVPLNPTTETVQSLTSTLQPGTFFPGSVSDQMVSADGTFDPDRQVLVADRLRDGQSGFWVITAFAVSGAPLLDGVGASPEVVIPVARGWVATADDATAPPSGNLTVTGRLIPSEAPVPQRDPGPGRATAVSVAELINIWNVSSYPGFVAATSEVAGGVEVGAAAGGSSMESLDIGPQPAAQKINWLSLFYAIEWIVFAGFALFIWLRLVRDDHQRDLEEAYDEEFGVEGDELKLAPTRTASMSPQPRNNND